jgi:hypothetical protein
MRRGVVRLERRTASLAVAGILAMASAVLPAAPSAAASAQAQAVTIRGYAGDAMEPHITRDGRFLLFNNSNQPPADTNLHYAERIDDLTFQYRGEIAGVNTTALDAVPTTDRAGNLYFVSTRSYPQTFSTIYTGKFADGRVSGLRLVPGVSRGQPGMVNFDVEVSPDGGTLYFVDSQFEGGRPRWAHLVIASKRPGGFMRAPDSDHLLYKVNAEGMEYAPCISADGLTLFFTRGHLGLRRAGASIFVAMRPALGEPFAKPQRLPIAGFVEGPALSADQKSLYFHRRDGGRFAIYRVPLG